MNQTNQIRDYKDLIVWRKSMDLVKQVYALTAVFPSDERFGLSNQMRRAAVSIPSNIAEGQSRLHRTEFRQFLGVALGSAAEVDTQIIIAAELGYVSKSDSVLTGDRTAEIRRMIRGLLKTLDASSSNR